MSWVRNPSAAPFSGSQDGIPGFGYKIVYGKPIRRSILLRSKPFGFELRSDVEKCYEASTLLLIDCEVDRRSIFTNNEQRYTNNENMLGGKGGIDNT